MDQQGNFEEFQDFTPNLSQDSTMNSENSNEIPRQYPQNLEKILFKQSLIEQLSLIQDYYWKKIYESYENANKQLEKQNLLLTQRLSRVQYELASLLPLTSEIANLKKQNSSLKLQLRKFQPRQQEAKLLKDQNSSLKQQNSSLKQKNSSLQHRLWTFQPLQQEAKLLKDQNSSLKQQLQKQNHLAKMHEQESKSLARKIQLKQTYNFSRIIQLESQVKVLTENCFDKSLMRNTTNKMQSEIE